MHENTPENSESSGANSGGDHESQKPPKIALFCRQCPTPLTSRQIRERRTFCSMECFVESKQTIRLTDRRCACGCDILMSEARARRFNYLPWHKTQSATVAVQRNSLCACGCGEPLRSKTTWNPVTKQPVRFNVGHSRKSKEYRREIVCPQCSTVFHVRKRSKTRYCSSRCGALASATKREQSRPRITMASPDLQRKRVWESRAHQCEDCGYDEHPEVLEVHHLNENRKDGQDANLKLLCPTCHEVRHFLRKTGRYWRRVHRQT